MFAQSVAVGHTFLLQLSDYDSIARHRRPSLAQRNASFVRELVHKSTFQRPLNHGRAFVAVADAADVCDVEYSMECLRMVKAADFCVSGHSCHGMVMPFKKVQLVWLWMEAYVSRALPLCQK